MKKFLFLVSLLCVVSVFVWCDKQPTQPENQLPNTNEQETYNETPNNTNEVNNEETNIEPETLPEPQYVTDTHEDMSFEEIGDALSKCDELWPDPICGKDWGTYYNRCYLDFAWIEESTEASIVDWICVF